MNNKESGSCQTEPNKPSCATRRQFLVNATAGGLVLSLAGAVSGQVKQDSVMPTEETILKLTPDSPLAKVGGSQTIETKAGKVIVARVGENNFVAYSAKCTHSGGPLGYDASAKQFTCPWHGSTFSPEGQNTGGPARRPLKPYEAQNALVIGPKSVT